MPRIKTTRSVPVIIATSKDDAAKYAEVRGLDLDDVEILTPRSRTLSRGVKSARVYLTPSMRTHDARRDLTNIARGSVPDVVVEDVPASDVFIDEDEDE